MSGFGGVVVGVDLLEAFDGEVGVEFGGFELLVAEELLDGAEIGPVVEEVGGAGMAEEVTGAFLFGLGALDVFADEVAQSIGVEGLTSGVEEEGGFLSEMEEFGSAFFEVLIEPMESALTKGKVAVFASFALTDDDDLAVLLEVVEGEVGGFVASDASGVEDFEEGFVADSGGAGEVGEGEDGFDFGDGEESFGEALGELWEVEVGGWIGGESVLFAEPGEEGADLNKAVVLHVEGEGLAFGGAVVEEVALVAFEDFLGDGGGAVEGAVFAPREEVAEGFAA